MAITINILDSSIINDPNGVPIGRTADIDISDNGTSYFLRVGNCPIANGLQAHLNGRASELFALAQAQGVVLDIGEQIRERVVLKALISVMFDENNTLRVALGFQPYTAAQVRQKLKNKILGV
jgi:hypothetical protein